MSAYFLILRFFLKLFFSAFVFIAPLSAPARAEGVDITSFGHSALLIEGGGHSVLLNPFKAVGCASGLKEPKVNAKVILASSELADEGSKIGRGVFLVKPGLTQFIFFSDSFSSFFGNFVSSRLQNTNSFFPKSKT